MARSVEKRLVALEECLRPHTPLVVERWIVTPGQSDMWLHSRFVAGEPESMEIFEGPDG